MEHINQLLVLAGSNLGWNTAQWTGSDDRVRGGKSQSRLDCRGTGVFFHGLLDINALGGAGFASQRTVGDDRHWDLSSFAGVEISIDPSQSDDKVYTVILKDHLLPPNPLNGREQSTISWQSDFSKTQCRRESEAEPSTAIIFIPWNHFKPTYRGKPETTTQDMNLAGIKRISIMIKSFFGRQQGDFGLHILSIAACSSPDSAGSSPAATNQRSG